jgi:hypothetical protein
MTINVARDANRGFEVCTPFARVVFRQQVIDFASRRVRVRVLEGEIVQSENECNCLSEETS